MDEFQKKHGMTAERYVRKNGNRAVTLKALTRAMDPILDAVVDVEKRIDKLDSHALLEAEAMKSLESGAAAIRDYSQSLMYTRSAAETETMKRKDLPAWLR